MKRKAVIHMLTQNAAIHLLARHTQDLSYFEFQLYVHLSP